MRESSFNEFAHSVRLAGSQHEVVAFTDLHNSPHPFDIFRRVSPIAFCVEVAEKQFLLHPVLDGSDATRNFASDESLASPWALMVKHNAVAGAETVALAVIHRCPIRKNLGDTIRAARPERCLLVLRHLLGFPEHFAAGCLKKTRTQSRFADRFQDPDRADACNIGCVFRNIEAHAHVALCTEMINLVRFQFVKKLYQINGIAEVAVMEEHSDTIYVRIGVEMINARSVECARATDNPVDFVAFL